MSAFNFSRTLPIILGIIFIIGFSPNLLADHAWGNYHWERAANPVNLTLGDNFSYTSWNTPYTNAVADWNVSSVLNLTAVEGNTRPKRCSPDAGTIEVCTDEYGNNGWLGIARIYVSGEHITKAFAKMNDSYYTPGSSYDTAAWRALVMCQEIGHTFGLGHQDEDFNNPNLNTCMDYTSNPISNQHPNEHDYEMLETIYSHLDSSGGEEDGGSCNPRSPWCSAGVDVPFPFDDVDFPGNGPNPQWGNLVQRSLDGHQEVYVLDLGNGNKVITHVTWVESRNRSHHEH